MLCVMLSVAGCKKEDRQGESSSPERQSAVNKRADHPYGDMIVIASVGEPLNLIPILAQDSASHDVAGFVYSGLVTTDKDVHITGDLAERWEISEDNTTITFHLRRDVKWHDGEPFTAKDVIFTYRFLLDNNTPTPYDADFRKIAGIAAPDDYTVVVRYQEPFAPALASWGMYIMPEHLLDGVLPTKSPLQRKPVGTGPYVFENWTANQHLTLRANPDYYKGMPYIEKIRFRYFQDQAAAFLELLKGTVDIMPLTAAQFAKQTDTDRFKAQYNTYRYLNNAYAYVGYNLTRKPFDDKRVRQALSYATPQQQIIDTVLHGMGIAATGPYKPGTIWHNPNVRTYPYDLDKARALLEEAGFTKNSRGMLQKDGKVFRIELVTNQNTTRGQIAEILQNSWQQLGIEVTIRMLEWGTFITDTINNRNFDATILAWNIVIDPDAANVWHSKSCEEKSTLNFICFQNGEVDSLLDNATQTFDPPARKKYYDRFQEILAEEQPYTFLYVPDELYAVSNRISGVEAAASGIFHNHIDWYVPENKQKYQFKK